MYKTETEPAVATDTTLIKPLSINSKTVKSKEAKNHDSNRRV